MVKLKQTLKGLQMFLITFDSVDGRTLARTVVSALSSSDAYNQARQIRETITALNNSVIGLMVYKFRELI